MNNIDIAKTYYQALYSKDFERVRSLASPNMTFSDPTVSSEQSLPTSHKNLDDFLDYMDNSLSDEAKFEVSITHAFESNAHVVVYVSSKVTAPDRFFGGSSDTVMQATTQGITVFHIDNGLIQSHVDYFDYAGLAESLAAI